MNVNARYPGSSHDSFVWRSSMASAKMVNEHERDPNTRLFLLGDSGYPLQPWLMVPVPNARTPAELYYNQIHSKTRNKVERCIGVLKNRFRCLIYEQKLRYSHLKASRIINSCAVLHNYLCSRHVDDDDDGHNLPDNDHNENNNIDNSNRIYRQQGQVVRDELIDRLYNDRNLN